jgi:hypothetical protein
MQDATNSVQHKMQRSTFSIHENSHIGQPRELPGTYRELTEQVPPRWRVHGRVRTEQSHSTHGAAEPAALPPSGPASAKAIGALWPCGPEPKKSGAATKTEPWNGDLVRGTGPSAGGGAGSGARRHDPRFPLGEVHGARVRAELRPRRTLKRSQGASRPVCACCAACCAGLVRCGCLVRALAVCRTWWHGHADRTYSR